MDINRRDIILNIIEKRRNSNSGNISLANEIEKSVHYYNNFPRFSFDPFLGLFVDENGKNMYRKIFILYIRRQLT